ncbi:MAG: hypothetical protein ICV74_05535 [Thermoleophilia bacterium]|nr:hypothetical protein [Thermoleophilia bacterium]
METLPLVVLTAAVLVPLAREYTALRREWGLSRLGAAATACAVFPALAFGIAASLPLAERPALQWLAAVVLTAAAYSAVTAALRPGVADEAPRRSS